MQEGTYTIDIPGLTDFIRIPALEDSQLRRDRIERMKTHESPVPEVLEWIPSVITMLDDAQDLLFTGLVLAKPLLRRLPTRLVPGLGWVLTANDVVNAGTAILGSTLVGRGPKGHALRMLPDLLGSKARRVERVADFLDTSQWFGFAVQAPQAVESITGYGLVLGALMGTISDTVWGAIRALDGAQVEIRGPPPDTLLDKAANFLLESWEQVFSGQILSQDDHTLLLAASSLAAATLAQSPDHAKIRARAPALAQTTVPVRRPWNHVSQNSLELAGIRTTGPIRPFIPTPHKNPTFVEAARIGAASTDRYFRELRTVYGPTSRGTIASVLANDAGRSLWEGVNGPGSLGAPIYDDFDKFIGKTIEHGVLPIKTLTPGELLAWYRAAMQLAATRGYNIPGPDELKTAANAAISGWSYRAIGN